MPAGAFVLSTAAIEGLDVALALKLDKSSGDDLTFTSAAKGVVFTKPDTTKARMTLDNDNAPNMNAVA